MRLTKPYSFGITSARSSTTRSRFTMIAFSENILFYDAEFTDLDPKKGELLSIGMVKPTGEELYLEFEHTKPVHPWVTEHVMPHLEGITFSREDAVRMIRQFVGDSEPFLVSYVNQLDAVYWYDLFGSAKDHPAFWIPIDFASIIFGYGFAPNSMGNHKFRKTIGVPIDPDQPTHNALDDARLLRKAYKGFFEYIAKQQGRGDTIEN